MNVVHIETNRREPTTRKATELVRALTVLTEVGIEFTVVCEGSDPFCPGLHPSAAA